MVTDNLQELECEVCENLLNIDPSTINLGVGEYDIECKICGTVTILQVKYTYYTDTSGRRAV